MNNSWFFSPLHNSPCKVIEEQTLWGQTVCRVWLPNQDAVVRVPKSALRPIHAPIQPELEAPRIAYIAVAAKVAELLEGSINATEGHILLAPMESKVTPLPHQLNVLSRAISGDRVRYLLADEVGLGKTVEAGLIMRELKLRGLVRRTLVVAPKGLASQWLSEMQTHFNETFYLVLGDDISTLQRLTSQADHASSAWSRFDQVIVSLDSVKPLDNRRGWSQERVDAYNRSRFESLVTAGWDMVVVDEAHRLGGSTEQVARYKLGKGLAEAAPYMLLLSATPHQGKTDAFHRLISLLDDNAFPDIESISRDRVAPYIIRTEKRKAIDAEGKPLFKPRRTQMIPVAWDTRHHAQQLLYEAVTDYVREGYNQAMLEKKHHIGFLMILMQRLVVSSTRAIRTTLERRLAVLQEDEQEAHLNQLNQSHQFLLASAENRDDEAELYDLYDSDGQELLDTLLKSRMSALQNEASHVQTLLDAALRCEQTGPDAKAEALLEWIVQLQAEENEPDLKVLIFTEFVPTQTMLREFLEARAISVVTLNGSMGMEERKEAQKAFRQSHRVLVSTDAGGEGLNLQFAHVVINYDIPWNPMRLEQRIGRVDRIGQPKIVRAINLVFENSIEFRVREVLEEKLAVIFQEFGIDKTGDVLDSAQAGELFEEVFTSAILHPDNIDASIEHTVAQIRDNIEQVRENSVIYDLSEEPDTHTVALLRSHPLPHWLERMTVSYLKAHGGTAKRNLLWWDVQWPDSKTACKAVFTAKETERLPDATLLNLENSRIRGLAMNLPQMGHQAVQPLPCVIMRDLPPTIEGFWGLFEIRLQAGAHQKTQLLRIPLLRRAYISVFLSTEGTLFLPTARHIWDVMQSGDIQVQGSLGQEESQLAFSQLHNTAEEAGQEAYNTLLSTQINLTKTMRHIL